MKPGDIYCAKDGKVFKAVPDLPKNCASYNAAEPKYQVIYVKEEPQS